VSSQTTIIEEMPGEITWEILNCDGRWFVWASHTSDDEHSFKFSEADDDLKSALARLAHIIKTEGPDWVRAVEGPSPGA